MIFVGRLGPQAVAAVSIGGIEDERETAKTVLGPSILLSVASAAVIAVSGYIFAEPVLRLLGAGLRRFGNAKTPMIALGIGFSGSRMPPASTWGRTWGPSVRTEPNGARGFQSGSSQCSWSL